MIFALAFGARAEDVSVKLETVTSDGVTYSNVTVVAKTASHVTIQHSLGMASLKARGLDQAARRRLGYEVEERPSGIPVALTGKNADPRVKEFRDRVEQDVRGFLQETDEEMLWKLGALFGILYLFFCYCCAQICKKTNNKPGLLIWLPIFQMIPLLRAAGMSPWLFLLLFVPGIGLIIGIVWCFRITRVRQKSSLLAIFLLLPVTNILAFLYLALSGHPRGAEPKQEDKKIRLSFNPSSTGASYG